jgi:dephospho-CoA kinase
VEEAEERIRSQADIEGKARRADFVLNNMGSAADLKVEVGRLVSRLKRGLHN